MNTEIVVNTLIEWGKGNTDDFPWRNPDSVYNILVAEIMLIRTAAEQVEPVYMRFIEDFPTVEDLYVAQTEYVEEKIQNLGLQWRAKRLKELSKYVVKDLEGHFPENKTGLRQIPGVGPYIAAGVMTFYFKRRTIMIDSNTVRFFERYSDILYTGEGRRSPELKARMEEVVPDDNEQAITFNVSFLDFMRKVCKPPPRNPVCKECPIKNTCSYYLQRRVE